MEKLDSLSKRIGYTFQNKSLLIQALTHKSFTKDSNERLEFLGDSILNLIISEELFNSKKVLDEGELSHFRANLVKGEMLAKIATDFGIGECLILGSGEDSSGGRLKESILGDALEALIAAIYIDTGFQSCKKIIVNWFKNYLDEMFSRDLLKDSKTSLQEYLQSKGFDLPTYDLLSISGHEHEQLFLVKCKVKGYPYITTGEGSSRRKAEQDAAYNFIKRLNDGRT